MSYSVEEVNGCLKKISFQFEKIDLASEIKSAIVEKQKTVAMKGFRKGKAPFSMVEQLYRPQLESDALNTFIQKEFYKSVTEEKLRVVGHPSIENMKRDEESMSFDALIEVFPEVEIKPMDKLEFTQEKIEVKEEDVEEQKKKYLESKAEMKVVEDDSTALENGLFAVMDFEGEQENGEKPENMKGKEFLLEIGSNQFIPGFEEGMIGMKKGEKRVVEVTFPEDYHAEELKGAPVKFHVELLEVKEKSFPEFSDEMAKEMGYESIEDFKTKTLENVRFQKERASKEKLNQQILEKLVEENSFDVPQALIAQQEEHLKKDMEGTLKQQGFNDSMVEEYFVKWQDDLKVKAKFQVRSGLILDKLGKEFEVEATEKELEDKIEETAKHSGLDIEQIRSYYTSDANIKQNMMYAIREEKTFAKIIEKVKVL